MIQHKSPISGVAAFKDRYIATAGYDNQVILWNAKNGNSLSRGMHDHLANQCQFSTCGHYLLSTSSDYTVRLWQLPSMHLLAVLADHEDDVESAAFHPRKNFIATASRDKKVRVFDFNGQLIYRFIGHEKDVISVAWLNDEEILSSSDDGTVRKWSITSQQQIESLDLGGIETDTIAIASDGTIFAGNDEGNILIIRNGTIDPITAHKAGIKRLCYSAEKNMLVSLSYDRSMILWKIKELGGLEEIASTSFPNIVWARSCAFLGEDKIALATFGAKYALYNYMNNTWDINNIQDTLGVNAVASDDQGNIYSIGDAGVLHINEKPHNKLPGLCNFLLKFGDALLSGGQTGEIYDALTGRVIYQHTSPLNCATKYTVNHKPYAIVGTYTGEGLVLGLDENNQPYFVKSMRLHQNAIKGIAANADFVFSVCADSAAAFHYVADLSLASYKEKAHTKIANACAQLNAKAFISVSRDLRLRVFSEEGIQEIVTPHKNSIKCVAVAKQGEFIASADYAGHICIYNKAYQLILMTRPTCAGISNIIANEKQYGFIASSYDGNLYFISWLEIFKEAS